MDSASPTTTFGEHSDSRRRVWTATPNQFILVTMDILFILIPLSVALALLILGALGWAVWRGQFESVDAEGERILRSD